MTENAGNSSNGQLIVTYSVRETAACGACACNGRRYVPAPPASTNINDAPPINGASCPDTTFTPAQKVCLASLSSD